MNPELFHLIPQMLDELFRYDPVLYKLVVYFVPGILAIAILLLAIRDAHKTRRREREYYRIVAELRARHGITDTEE